MKKVSAHQWLSEIRPSRLTRQASRRLPAYELGAYVDHEVQRAAGRGMALDPDKFLDAFHRFVAFRIGFAGLLRHLTENKTMAILTWRYTGAGPWYVVRLHGQEFASMSLLATMKHVDQQLRSREQA